MTEIPPSAFVRFRTLGERYRQAVAAENDIRRRLGDATHALRALQAQLARLTEPRYVAGLGGRLMPVEADADAIAEVGCRIKVAEAGIALLEREVEHAEGRKSSAGDLLNRCSAHLLDLGAERRQLEY